MPLIIEQDNNRIILEDYDCFCAKDILECGQIFRYRLTPQGYECFSLDRYASISGEGRNWVITTDDVPYFVNFFDLQQDYTALCNSLSSINEVMQKAVEGGRGIRILRQDLFETLICFIISANNNIKRIQIIVDKLCTACGAPTKYGYAFPTAQAIVEFGVEGLKSIGCGYRAKYLYDTALRICGGYDLTVLANMDTPTARRELTTFLGVGGKVADCVLLFGLHRSDCFPVDTWMEKVYNAYFGSGLKREQISKFFIDYFGINAGYAQQYLFYYQRQGNFQ